MKVNEILKKVDWKKVAVVAGAVITGISAASGAIDDHKQKEKIDDLERIVTELQKK